MLCRPRASELCIQNHGGGHACKTSGQQQARTQPLQQKHGGDERDQQLRERGPEYGRPDLIGFETMNRERLRNQNDRSQQAETEEHEQEPENLCIPLPQIRQINKRIGHAQPPHQRAQQKNRGASNQSVE